MNALHTDASELMAAGVDRCDGGKYAWKSLGGR